MFDMTTVSPEFMAELEERSKKVGFSSVQDYLVHLILVDKKFDTKKDKRNSKKSKKLRPVEVEDRNEDEIKTVSWISLCNYLRHNRSDFSNVRFDLPGAMNVLDSTVNTGGEKATGISGSRIEEQIRLTAKAIQDNKRIGITVCHNGENICFIRGKDESVFGVAATSDAGKDIIYEAFEEDSED